MIASNEFKRAAGLLEAPPERRAPSSGPKMLELSWVLSQIAPLPTKALADQLAGALLAINPNGATTVQLGRMVDGHEWKVESAGVAGRLASVSAPVAWGRRLPWPTRPTEAPQPVYMVLEASAVGPCLAPLEAALQRLNLRTSLCALAHSGKTGELVLTAQLAGVHRDRLEESAHLLQQVLPWVLSIVRVAMGERPGLRPRAWLTQREREVLGQLVGGASVVEIAKALDRSHYTVHDHVKSLHRKLGVKSRAALIGCATKGVPPPGVVPQAAFDDPRDLS